MVERSRSRRAVLGASAATVSVALGGCQGLLGGTSGDSSDEESGEDADDETEQDSDDGLLYSDDFESGSLDGYNIVAFPGDDDTESYHITTEPSRGEYAVRHRTESRYIVPEEEISLSPPLTFSLDFYVDRWSGIDIALQHDESRNLTYLVKVRSNNSGRFIEVAKKENEFADLSEVNLLNDRNENSTFSENTWETVDIDWEEDGTMTVTVRSTGESVSITDTDLTGHPFLLAGYHYSGWAAFDNLEIRR